MEYLIGVIIGFGLGILATVVVAAVIGAVMEVDADLTDPGRMH